MMNLHGCLRCNGAVVRYDSAFDSDACVNCGWRRQEIAADVVDMVEAHLGKAYLEDRAGHSRIGTGKPPLSGWDRVKRRRQREGLSAASSAVAI